MHGFCVTQFFCVSANRQEKERRLLLFSFCRRRHFIFLHIIKNERNKIRYHYKLVTHCSNVWRWWRRKDGANNNVYFWCVCRQST